MLIPSKLHGISPNNAPRLWMAVNALCFTYSTFILIMTFLVNGFPAGKMFVKQSSLWFNFTVTAVWCTKAGLNLWETEVRPVAWAQKVELAIAAYLVIESTILLIQWKYKKEHISRVGLNAAINFIVYGAALIKEFRAQRKQNEYDTIATNQV